ncbi:bifunctional diaminohydroxyphosphoribosylaminopyrimidine deaminase/5-amino-6-(5-phosphoribosylamino)uracil reductase RibD [Fundidesulfovibrio terrae]|uniref:bifunctional diaminohydroxyphosphoribosylaminopyrimidine deaminase/5-amino-6-(5-phosphoribosylamino)uracil reductase RibD n=1 Tax=Fundidesulfovibrio terrae TaxID=2922866 RepID=UPI001FB03246|nr:bifunctional diaminohydroxyphosphoribosylaminopyrimidine deaminase/5-amino-6-(5-phosphoribosylamino)uracil reductase RibD [Fundidesulfovibrio terrae]
MARALDLARRGKGATAPNPCVGAVLVRDGQVVAEGWHQRCGEAHAEVNCLADAASKSVDTSSCTLYVTLEPCNHHGKTPPCTLAVLAAGIKKVVVGCADPNPRVEGGGATFLRSKGVDVTVGVLERECLDMIADFRVWQFTPRTYNILKMAATLDGRIASRTGHAAWVSGPESRAAVHELRARVDAVIVGGATLRQDNPQLTVRLEGGYGGKQPLAVVVTSLLPEPSAPLALLARRPDQTIFWTDALNSASVRAEALRDLGVRVWELPASGESLDLAAGFAKLRSEAGCFTTLCEGGGRLALSLVKQGVMDEFLYFLAPKVIGDAMAVPVFSGDCVESMEQAVRLRLAGVRPSGQDLLLTYMPKDDPHGPA